MWGVGDDCIEGAGDEEGELLCSSEVSEDEGVGGEADEDGVGEEEEHGAA